MCIRDSPCTATDTRSGPRLAARSRACSTLDSLVTSVWTNSTASPNSLTSASAFSFATSAITTFAPEAARRRTVCSPSPPAPPVTIADAPLISMRTPCLSVNCLNCLLVNPTPVSYTHLSDRPVSSGLVLVDITPKSNPKGIERIQRFMQSGLDGFDSLEDAAAAIAAYTPNREKRVNPIGLQKVLRQRDGRWYWHWDPQFIGRGRTEVVADRLAGLLDVAMSNIHVPTLLVRGLLSDVVTQEGVDELMTKIPGATVVGVEGAAHMIAGDRNDCLLYTSRCV